MRGRLSRAKRAEAKGDASVLVASVKALVQTACLSGSLRLKDHAVSRPVMAAWQNWGPAVAGRH